MIQRFDDWPERLHDYLVERRSMPFKWGSHDCCTFACGAVNAQCGVDPMADIHGKYKTAKGAAVFILKNGGDLPKVAKIIGDATKLTSINPLMAGRGCVVMANVPGVDKDMPALGIVGLDSSKALFVSLDTGGWFEIPVKDCNLAWGFD